MNIGKLQLLARTFKSAFARSASLLALASLSTAGQAGVLTLHGAFHYWYDEIDFDADSGIYTAVSHKGSSDTLHLDVPVARYYEATFVLERDVTMTGEPVEVWFYDHNSDFSYWGINVFGPGSNWYEPGLYSIEPRPGDMMGELGDWNHAAGSYEGAIYPVDEDIPFILTLTWDDGAAVLEPGMSLLVLLGLSGLAAGARQRARALSVKTLA